MKIWDSYKAGPIGNIISRIESGSANTSISLMKRFAKALNTNLTIHIPKSI